MTVKRVTRLLMLTVVVAALVLTAPVAPAHGVADPTQRAQDVAYRTSASIPGVWSTRVEGDIRFHGTKRRFRVFGRLVVRGPQPALLFSTYLAVRHDVADTGNDGRWYTIGYPSAGSFDGNLGLTGGQDLEAVRNFVVGGRGGGEQFWKPTRPGQRLAGIRIRACLLQGGPDHCGSTVYVDNPYA